jgi:hypothetical protein
MKVVINSSHSAFQLSVKALKRIQELGGDLSTCSRTSPFLVQAVEELGDKANGYYTRLKIVEVPDDVNWTIQEYDGIEWVAEVHRTWK